MKRFALATLLVLIASASAWAQSAPAFSPEQAAALVPLKHKAEGAFELVKTGAITASQADSAAGHYLNQATKIAGRKITLAELAKVPDSTPSAPPTYLSRVAARVAGWLTFANILIGLGILLGAVCLLVMFGQIIADLLRIFAAIPAVVYEILGYAGSLALMWYGKVWSPELGHYTGLLGCLLFSGCIGFTLNYHKIKLENVASPFFLIITPVFAANAIYYQSAFIGIGASVGFMGALGFMAAMGPMCYVIGFLDDDSLARGTLVSFLTLALFVGMRATNISQPYLDVFAPGMLFMGSFVGYLGLLIASSKWYSGKQLGGYAGRQLFTIALGVAALFFGSVLDIPQLLKVGGTFFALYLVEKIAEIIDALEPKTVYGYCAAGLTVAGILISSGLYIFNHQGAFSRYLLFL